MSDLTDTYGCHKCGFMTCTCIDKPPATREKRLEAITRRCVEANADLMIECRECEGRGYIVEPEHHVFCDGSCPDGLCPQPKQVQCSECAAEGKYLDRPLHLADMLLASTKAYGYWDKLHKDLGSLQYDSLMGFIIVAVEPDETEYKDVTRVKWNLRDDHLSSQSDECIDFLHDILR